MHTPLAHLIRTRMHELGLDAQALGLALGCRNPLKATGRVQALCDGHLMSRKSRAALVRLHSALEVSPEVLGRAINATHELLAERAARAEEERRRAAEAEEAEWRRTFKPHAVVQTERTVPSQITICGLSGGAGRFLIVSLDLSKPPITFIQQAVAGLPEKGKDGRRHVMFFGEAIGLIINYSPDQAIRCDLDGNPVEILPKPYRIGEVSLSIGGRPVEPKIMARLLGGL